MLSYLAHPYDGYTIQDAIARIRQLEASGRLSGVFDDRGKYVSITPDELAHIAAYVRSSGRVSIAQLVRQSDNLIKIGGGAD